MPLVQIGLFRKHKGDPLSFLITEETRTDYTHACIIKNRLTNTISEAYVPNVRERVLSDDELDGIDIFDIEGLTAEQSQGILDECSKREAAKEPYAVENLFRFNPFLRVIFGEATDNNTDHQSVICSQYDLDVISDGAGIKLLNAPSYEVDPGHIAWSPLAVPAPKLNPLGIVAKPGESLFQKIAGELPGTMKLVQFVERAAQPASGTGTPTVGTGVTTSP